MKREAYFLPLSCAAAVSAGMILKMSAKWSDTAAWSYIISPVSNTPWELFKPFAIAYMFWILIELSCLRPHLLHFVCSKSIIKKVKNPEIYDEIMGSDHCPIGLEVNLK